MKNIYLNLLMILLFTTVNAQTNILRNYEGLYEDVNKGKYLLNPGAGFPHFVIMKSGETHMIRKTDEGVFEFSSTRNNWNKIGGTISFFNNNGQSVMQLSFPNGKTIPLNKVLLDSKELKLHLKDSLVISGNLIRSINPEHNAIAVLLHGDGDNDRYDLYDIGMYLVDNGYSVFAFDKRNVGNSYGKEVAGRNYDEISRAYADDGVKIVEWLTKEYPKNEVGVVGISQGGWIGSIISSKVPDLGFYVNIAGSISVGWQQWKHYMISYLKRNGFSKSDVSEAEDYFQTFFDLALGSVEFSTYTNKLSQYKEKEWFLRLKKRKLVEWKSEVSAQKTISLELNDPSEDILKVNSPTLGIFYQYDHSTPPESPYLFLKSLLSSNSNDVTVRVFPNTTHGGWDVENYYFDTSMITRQESKAYYLIVDWLNSLYD